MIKYSYGLFPKFFGKKDKTAKITYSMYPKKTISCKMAFLMIIVLAALSGYSCEKGNKSEMSVKKEQPIDDILLMRISGLREALDQKDELRAVRLIRYWVAITCNRCRGPECRDLSNKGMKQTLQEELNQLDNNQLGHLCGGFSNFCAKIYTVFGFPAAVLNVGVPNNRLSHVFNLVQITHNGQPLVIAEDPYINAEYALKGSQVTSFIDLVKSIKRGEQMATLVDHYPEVVRTQLLVKEGEPIKVAGKEKMFNSSRWFKMEINREGRQFLMKKLGVKEDNLTPFHMLLFPMSHRLYSDSPILKSSVDEYIETLKEL